MTVSFYIVRHGKTEFNRDHKVQGWCDSPLVAEGVRAARAAGAALAHVDFARAFSSDKERTRQTLAELLDARSLARGAEPDAAKGADAAEDAAKAEVSSVEGDAAAETPAAAGNAGVSDAESEAKSEAKDAEAKAGEARRPVSPSTPGAAELLAAIERSRQTGAVQLADGIPVRTDERLREWCYGNLEGRSGEQLHQRLNQGYGGEISFEEQNRRLPETADILARLDPTHRAESFARIEARLRSFLEEIGAETERAGGGNVLVASHAFTIRTMVYLYAPDRVNEPGVIKNGSITRIDYADGAFTVREIGVMELAD